MPLAYLIGERNFEVIDMFVSNNILSTLINSDAILFAEIAVKDSAVMVDQKEGLFQEVLQGAVKEEEMLTLLDQDEQVDQDEQDQVVVLSLPVRTRIEMPTAGREGIERIESEENMPAHQKEEVPVSSQEILSAVSFLSIVGVIPPPTSYQATWNPEPFATSVAMLSDPEITIQAILENATPSYVAQTTALGIAIGNNVAPDMDDSDLDSLISSLLLSKNDVDTSDPALADLRWNHFNEAILTDADKVDNDMKGFTFEAEIVKPKDGFALTGNNDEKSELVSLIEPFQTTTPAKSTKSIVADGQNLQAINAILDETDLLTPTTDADSKITFDVSVLEQTGVSSLKQNSDGVKTNAHLPEWRPEAQIAEHEIVKQVADKLSMQRFNFKGSEGVTIELEPKELGMLKIELSMHKNFVSADILTQHSSVRDILDKNQTILRDAMANMGFVVDHFSVNVGDFSHLPKPFSGHEQFNDASGTKFALDNSMEDSAESVLAMAGNGSRYWGHVESGISVYV